MPRVTGVASGRPARLRRASVLLGAAVVVAAAGFVGFRAGDGRDRMFEGDAVEAPTPTPTAARGDSLAPSTPPATASPPEVTAGLVIGSDEQEAVDGRRADVVMVALAAEGLAPALVSLPRDLWVDNPCTGSRSRLNAGLAGCGHHASGPELLSDMVAATIGVAVDHYVLVDFAGFTEIVDAVGGVEVCTGHPVRQVDLGLRLDAGCQTVDGATALAWVRSRHTEERIDGRWRPVEGVDDLDRTRRQRDLTVALLGEVARSGDPQRALEVAAALRRHATFDDDLGVDGLLGLGARVGDGDDVVRIEPRVTPHTTSGGAQVLELAEPLAATVRRGHPELAEAIWEEP